MLFLTSPDASPNSVNATQGVTPGVLNASTGVASGGEFARLLSGASAPRPLSTDAEATPELTPQLLNAVLGKAAAGDSEGQILPLGRQGMVGLLPTGEAKSQVPLALQAKMDALVAQPSTDQSALQGLAGEDDLSSDAAQLPSTSFLARLFGLGPTQTDAAEVLDRLDDSITDLSTTIAQLLGVKPLREAVDYDPESDGDFDVQAALEELGIEMPAEAVEQWVNGDTLVVDPEAVERLTQFLHEDLGLNMVQAEVVVNALTAWVQNPPQVNLTPEQLAASDTDQWQQVQQLTLLLDELGVQFSSWMDQLDAQANGQNSDAIANATPVLSKELRTLADALSGKSTMDSDGKTPSPAVMVARMLQSVQNSATNGTLPITLDQSRPEQALLLAPASQASHDVVFNTTLMRMARETLNTKAETETRLAAINGALGVEGDSAQTLSLSLSQSDAPDDLQVIDLRRVDRPLVSADVSRQLSERIQMMVQGDIKHATIRLDPPELGMLEIKISVHNDQTQVQIVSSSPQVREALESQSVRLREILEQQGLNLSNLDVRDQSSNGNAGSGEGQGGQGTAGNDDGLDAESVAAATPSRPLGLVDHFV